MSNLIRHFNMLRRGTDQALNMQVWEQLGAEASLLSNRSGGSSAVADAIPRRPFNMFVPVVRTLSWSPQPIDAREKRPRSVSDVAEYPYVQYSVEHDECEEHDEDYDRLTAALDKQAGEASAAEPCRLRRVHRPRISDASPSPAALTPWRQLQFSRAIAAASALQAAEAGTACIHPCKQRRLDQAVDAPTQINLHWEQHKLAKEDRAANATLHTATRSSNRRSPSPVVAEEHIRRGQYLSRVGMCHRKRQQRTDSSEASIMHIGSGEAPIPSVRATHSPIEPIIENISDRERLWSSLESKRQRVVASVSNLENGTGISSKPHQCNSDTSATSVVAESLGPCQAPVAVPQLVHGRAPVVETLLIKQEPVTGVEIRPIKLEAVKQEPKHGRKPVHGMSPDWSQPHSAPSPAVAGPPLSAASPAVAGPPGQRRSSVIKPSSKWPGEQKWNSKGQIDSSNQPPRVVYQVDPAFPRARGSITVPPMELLPVDDDCNDLVGICSFSHHVLSPGIDVCHVRNYLREFGSMIVFVEVEGPDDAKETASCLKDLLDDDAEPRRQPAGNRTYIAHIEGNRVIAYGTGGLVSKVTRLDSSPELSLSLYSFQFWKPVCGLREICVAVVKDPLSRGRLADEDSTTFDAQFIIEHKVRLLLGNVPGLRGVRLLHELRRDLTVNAITHPWSADNRIWWIGNIGRVLSTRLPNPGYFPARTHEPHDSASLLIEKVKVKKIDLHDQHHFAIGMFFGSNHSYRTTTALQRRIGIRHSRHMARKQKVMQKAKRPSRMKIKKR